MLLCNPRVRKAGRQVNSDLRYLQDRVNAPPFIGALDLAYFAKERHVVSNARCSLSDLCAITLQKCLRKNVSERLSMAWEHDVLTMEQIRYAACDAYAPLLIFQELSKLDIPKRLTDEQVVPLTPVILYNSDNTVIIARGCLSANLHLRSFDGLNLSPSRILLDISEVVVPAAIMSTHHKQPLSAFGAPPFSLVCLRSHVRTHVPATQALRSQQSLPTTTHEVNPSPMDDLSYGSESGRADESHQEDSVEEGEADGIGNTVRDVDDSNTPGNLGACQSKIDGESHALGQEILGEQPSDSDWEMVIRSRVLKDVFHVFNMLRISTMHGLRKEFARVLRDAIFIPDEQDRARIAAWGATLQPPKTFEQFRAAHPSWLWRHCKRVIPPPKILYPLIEHIFLTYGPLKDATTCLPLFNRQNWHTSKQILDLIRQGFVSDPPNIPLYTTVGTDVKAGNLPIYRCFRGTNFTEGGVHTHICSRLPASQVSICHIQACLTDFVLQHNLRVSICMPLFKFPDC